MKLRDYLLAASLLANAVLFSIVFLTPEEPLAEMVAVPTREAAVARPSSTPASPSVAPFSWRSLESPDYRQYIDNLRAIGCPEETIQDLIISEINKLYAGELRKLSPPETYWRAMNRLDLGKNHALSERKRQIEREKAEILKSLLGIDYREEMDRMTGTAASAWRFDFLPAEKLEPVKAVMARYESQLEAILSRSGGVFLPEDSAVVSEMLARRDKELAALLTPEEKTEFDLRNSPEAQSLRARLLAFEPNESEFRKLYDLQKEHAGNSQAAEKALEQLLGPKRYAEYVRSQDPEYVKVYTLVDGLGLSTEIAGNVYALKQSFMDEASRVAVDAGLDSRQKQSELAALRMKTLTAMKQVMGDRAYSLYAAKALNWLH